MEAGQNYILGMDCGTTNIKAVILSEDGRCVAEASRPNTFIHVGTLGHEQDANVWWNNAVDIFHSLVHQTGQTVISRIRGICVSSHTVSMLPLDEAGQPVRNAITYQDGRSFQELKTIVQEVGFEKFVHIVGGRPSVAFLPNKLLWYKNHEPENYQKTAWYLQASSYINFKLTGVLSTDVDQATRTQCLDISTMRWSGEIAKAIEMDLDRCMPKLCAVDEIIGCVSKRAADETGLAPGTPVVAGCSDAMASMIATGITKIGEVGESSGTTSLVFIGSEKPSSPDAPVVTRPCPIDGIPWIFDAPIQTSGAALKWYIDLLAGEEREYCRLNDRNIYSYLNEQALKAEPGCRGLLFFPYLLGERAPLWNDYARGMFLGLGMDTTREEMTRAVFEGTAFALRHVVETVKESGGVCNSLRVCGGGAKSRTWSRIKASMLHCPVKVLDSESGDVPVGDALLVGRRVGMFQDLAGAEKDIIRVQEVIDPDPEWEKAYDALYPYFVEMYQALDPKFRALQQTMTQLGHLKTEKN